MLQKIQKRFDNISLKIKLTALVGVLILQALFSIVYLRQQLEMNYNTVIHQQETSYQFDTVSSLYQNYQKMLYWHTEVAVSMSEKSEKQINIYKKNVTSLLEKTQSFSPKISQEISESLPVLSEKSLAALDFFFDDDRNGATQEMEGIRDLANQKLQLLEAEIKVLRENAEKASETLKESSLNAVSLTTISLIFFLITATLIAWILKRIIINPIMRMTHNMKDLSQNNFDINIIDSDRGDEVGDMARTLEVFKDNGIKAIELQKQKEHDTKIKTERASQIENLVMTFETTVQDIAELLKTQTNQVQSATQGMLLIVDESNSTLNNANTQSEQANTSVNEVAMTVDQFNLSIQEIANQINTATAVTRATVEHTHDTNEKVSNLSNSAERIGSAVQLIEEIAEKTNLLALNATIEAARAGDAGRGFAVVANEVKTLASQTSDATNEISTLIKDIQDSTQMTVTSMTDITTKIGEISESSTIISSAIDEQQATIQSVADNAQNTANSNNMVREGIQEVVQSSSETQKAAQNVLQSVDTMVEKQNELDDLINTFLSNIRAA